MSEITGIVQSDLLIRSALIEGIADLRRHPELLDYVFASLPRDELTASAYGQKEADLAKGWFLKTEVVVFMSTRLDKPKFPSLSISLLESSEAEKTLADVHSTPQEDNDLEWRDLTPRFAPSGYTASTGVMTIPDVITAELFLSPGMVIMDSVGVSHEIVDVTDRGTIVLAEGTVADFGHATIRGASPSRVVTIESVKMKESYQIGCHVHGESWQLMALHSIVCFILLRYRESLLEARGFERTSISSSDFRRDDFLDVENVFSRHVTISGYVQQMWPKLISEKITGTVFVPAFVAVDRTVTDIDTGITVDSEDAFLIERDSLAVEP